ncbi:hypothetical protein DMH04_10935 [Kibdelosporangium aridum]|uniref:Uncharacterized protein n=1 Tax=Kibdelosporangium aridum TaxID=2030 RepID=A0A428ZHJ2_KIBAR|nr:hypothetical protein [Kibdelosporangium aridum]RSM87524.1 hypothetical protein DMH04_10935 [Kibdelosporangium aridum]
MNEEISRQLREAAGAHQPDRARMQARLERGMAGATGRRRTSGIATSWPKVTLAGFAAAGILATAGLTVAGILHSTPTPPDIATTPADPSPSGTPSSTSSARATDGSAPPSAASQPGRTTTGRTTSGNPTSASPTYSQLSDGPLSSEGFIDPDTNIYWAQSRLVFTTTQPLTTLTVQLRIAQTGGVQSTGHWQTGPGDDFTLTVQEIGGALVYRWDLKPGRTVPAAQHTFAAQYNHAAGTRNANADSYRAQATTAGGAFAVRGGFTPAG